MFFQQKIVLKHLFFKCKDFNSNSLNILVNLLPDLLQNHNIKSLFVDSIVNFLDFKPIEKKTITSVLFINNIS